MQLNLHNGVKRFVLLHKINYLHRLNPAPYRTDIIFARRITSVVMLKTIYTTITEFLGNFNPRCPSGQRQNINITGKNVNIISIHAARMGSDMAKTVAEILEIQ